MDKERKIEICCGDVESVIAACKGGADRIELCSALSEGGITPSIGLIKKAVSICRSHGVRTHVLIRPRSGDFVYSDDEVEVMCNDIIAARLSGADGVVIGTLNPDGSIDMKAMEKLMHAAKGVSVTFHRAFDVCADPDEALEQIIALGCERILTSGCMPSAEEGIDNLKRFVDKARGRIIILAGAGITPDNAAKIAQQTGVCELHGSARALVPSAMTFRREDVHMGAPGEDEYARKVTNADVVSLFKKNLFTLCPKV